MSDFYKELSTKTKLAWFNAGLLFGVVGTIVVSAIIRGI